MKFGSILDLFRSDNWSNELVEGICAMLETGAEMFDYAIAVIVYGEPDEDGQAQIYDRDRSINQRVRQIRRRVVARLSTSDSKAEIPTALIFMNAVKDVERIGDYMKNLYEIGALMPAEPDRALYQEALVGRARTIEDLFIRTLQSFAESDTEKAREVIDRTRRFGQEAEAAIRELTHGDLPTADAVCLVLAIRFLKRIVMHMNNVATTVVMPIDNLDFYDEPEKTS